MKLDKNTTASFDVDAQKGFTPLCPGELPVPEGDKIVDELNNQAKFACIRVGSKDAHPINAKWEATPEQPQFSTVGLLNVDIRWNRHCIVGTKGGELLDGLPKEIDYNYFVWKGIEPDLHPYGACYHDLDEFLSTGVIEFLKQHNIKTVIVAGLATDYCVKTTAIQLRKAEFEVILNLGGCRGIAEKSTAEAVKDMMSCGITVIHDSGVLE